MRWIGRIGVGSVVLVASACGASQPAAPVVPTEFLPATTLAKNTVGEAGTTSFAGQSVLAAGTGRLYNLRFSWELWAVPGRNRAPTAFGTLYLLDREYLGAPSALSPSMPGFVSRSTSTSSTEYIFPESVSIEGGRTYWFYTDARGDFMTSWYLSVYNGGDMYNTGTSTGVFQLSGAGLEGPVHAQVPIPREKYFDANFTLTGSLPKR
jgi:hypothetical protein